LRYADNKNPLKTDQSSQDLKIWVNENTGYKQIGPAIRPSTWPRIINQNILFDLQD
jgi:hypothetical protein